MGKSATLWERRGGELVKGAVRVSSCTTTFVLKSVQPSFEHNCVTFHFKAAAVFHHIILLIILYPLMTYLTFCTLNYVAHQWKNTAI